AQANLVQEIQRSLDFYSATSADDKVQKVYISGGVAKAPGIRAAIEERLGIPVDVLNPFRHITVSDKDFDPEYIEAVAPLFAVAVGLGMRRLGDK
ncbi:MAG: pilus assembly protein PilM, partial [Deltaproteobacteria bacterium]